jgi:hypothetical protein
MSSPYSRYQEDLRGSLQDLFGRELVNTNPLTTENRTVLEQLTSFHSQGLHSVGTSPDAWTSFIQPLVRYLYPLMLRSNVDIINILNQGFEDQPGTTVQDWTNIRIHIKRDKKDAWKLKSVGEYGLSTIELFGHLKMMINIVHPLLVEGVYSLPFGANVSQRQKKAKEINAAMLVGIKAWRQIVAYNPSNGKSFESYLKNYIFDILDPMPAMKAIFGQIHYDTMIHSGDATTDYRNCKRLFNTLDFNVDDIVDPLINRLQDEVNDQSVTQRYHAIGDLNEFFDYNEIYERYHEVSQALTEMKPLVDARYPTLISIYTHFFRHYEQIQQLLQEDTNISGDIQQLILDFTALPSITTARHMSTRDTTLHTRKWDDAKHAFPDNNGAQLERFDEIKEAYTELSELEDQLVQAGMDDAMVRLRRGASDAADGDAQSKRIQTYKRKRQLQQLFGEDISDIDDDDDDE